MRLLPRSRKVRVAVAVSLAVMALGTCVGWYRPWEAHYRGQPASRWAECYVTWGVQPVGSPFVRPKSWMVFPGANPAPVRFWHRWAAALGIRLAPAEPENWFESQRWELFRGNPETVPVLRELLRNPLPGIRQIAVYGLNQVGTRNPEAAAALASAINDSDSTVREIARSSLRRFGTGVPGRTRPTSADHGGRVPASTEAATMPAIRRIADEVYPNSPAEPPGGVVKVYDPFADRRLVSFAEPPITKRLKEIEVLHICSERITDASLEDLEYLEELRELHLYCCSQITDSGLEHLQRFAQLEALDLDSTKVTGDGLRHLKGLTNLTALNLNYCPLTDAGLDALKDNRRIKRFSLAGTAVTDDGLARLATMSELTELNLTGTRVTDAGLAHLKGLNQLGILTLFETKVTDKGLADLKKSLPQLTVVR